MQLLVLVLALSAGTPEVVPAVDRDGDGVRDELERALVERFEPQFWLDVNECAGRPAQFRADSVEPRVLAHNGAIYTRVTPSATPRVMMYPNRVSLIVSYFHLWDRDCGPLSPHPLDVEHVSALIAAPSWNSSVEDWVALYWYAAAHEDTICDTSNAARAEAIGARTGGPNVWIAKGKHASYLSRSLCSQRGCGVDACKDMTAMPAGPLLSLGEADAPDDGAAWIAFTEWSLASKLRSDFDARLLERLHASDEPVLARANGQWRPQHYSLSIGSDILGALGKATEGLQEADETSGNALGRVFGAVGSALGAAVRAVGSTLDPGHTPPPAPAETRP